MTSFSHPVITAIYAFSAFCLFVAWYRYHETWGVIREPVHLGFTLLFAFLAGAGWAVFVCNRRRDLKRETKHED